MGGQGGVTKNMHKTKEKFLPLLRHNFHDEYSYWLEKINVVNKQMKMHYTDTLWCFIFILQSTDVSKVTGSGTMHILTPSSPPPQLTTLKGCNNLTYTKLFIMLCWLWNKPIVVHDGV